jgi:hypothetical protein
MNIKNVIFPTRPQIDTICAFFILSTYGANQFPELQNANILTASVPDSAERGSFIHSGDTLLLDCNESVLDHHNKPNLCLTDLVIDYLGLSEKKELHKIKAFARRDDLEGKGIISQDKLDKAFGLPGLLTNLNKLYPNDPNTVFKTVLPFLDAHVKEELRREYEMPDEVAKASADGSFRAFTVTQKGKSLKCCTIHSDNVSIAGYLRSQLGGNYDVVVQLRSNGYVAILTKKDRVSLRGLALVIRLEELSAKNLSPNLSVPELASFGTLADVPEWYYDSATNSLFNGTSAHQDVPVSKIEKNRIQEIVILGLSESMFA